MSGSNETRRKVPYGELDSQVEIQKCDITSEDQQQVFGVEMGQSFYKLQKCESQKVLAKTLEAHDFSKPYN
jgi:hypothetical protein